MCNMLNNKLTAKEEKLMFQLGGVAQYLDDVFDLREDVPRFIGGFDETNRYLK